MPRQQPALVMFVLVAFAACADTPPAPPPPPDPPPPTVLNAHATEVVSALCAWPAVSDGNLRAAWNLVIDTRAPTAARTDWITYAHGLQAMPPDKALPAVWLAMFLHPSFLLEQ